MHLSTVLMLALLPFLLAVIALCGAAETALFSLSRTDRLRLRRLSPIAATAAAKLLSRPRSLILAILLVTNAANITFFLVVSVVQWHMPNEAVGIAFNLVLLVFMIVVGDLLPKLLAAPRRVAFARFLAAPLAVLLRVVGPVTGFLESWLVDPSLRLLRPSRGDLAGSVTVEELSTLLDLSARSGVIEEDEQRLLADVIRLGSTRIRDVMIPRIAMPGVADRFAAAEVVRVLRKAPLAKIPVFRGSLDGKPLGMLDTRAFLAGFELAPDPAKAAILRDSFAASLEPVVFIPERSRLDQLLDLMRVKQVQSVLCVDEYGAVVGMITISEVLREMVAGVPGAAGDAGTAVERRSEKVWVVPGRLPARQFARQLGAQGSTYGAVSTVAGLFFQRLGRVPQVGDTLVLGNVRLTVEAMSGRVVDRVVVSLEARAGAAGGVAA